ncbi:hypothetical protein C0Q70_01462 [Pomacea canaliculata]|uniref:Uncharacterized protein n=2 Tax=Pomacea canaliculata TaxID=400727 RepID=A0A2T7PZJ4_POMCA|nr:hypothetical protein C0Q70_01462 [Pomacea canaliculata]
MANSSVPEGVYFELSPTIVWSVRIVNAAVTVLVLITFILCVVKGNDNSSYYLLACNTLISTFVGIVINWWYRRGDLGSELFWYILVVGFVLAFQCITADIFIYKVTTPEPTPAPVTNSTRIYTWASFRPNNSLVQIAEHVLSNSYTPVP